MQLIMGGHQVHLVQCLGSLSHWWWFTLCFD